MALTLDEECEKFEDAEVKEIIAWALKRRPLDDPGTVKDDVRAACGLPTRQSICSRRFGAACEAHRADTDEIKGQREATWRAQRAAAAKNPSSAE